MQQQIAEMRFWHQVSNQLAITFKMSPILLYFCDEKML